MTHKNPTGYWTYVGPYTILLVDSAPTKHLPSTVEEERVEDGILIHIRQGHIHQVMGGIQFYDELGQTFHWGYSLLKEIREPNGTLIWHHPKP